MGIIQFSDPTGQFEAILFSEGLAAYGDMLEPGQSVVITVNAENRPEGISLRIETVQSLEHEAERIHKTMRIFVRNADMVEEIGSSLERGGDGDVGFIIIKDNGAREIEVSLPHKYRVTPQVAGAMKAIRGIVDVELV